MEYLEEDRSRSAAESGGAGLKRAAVRPGIGLSRLAPALIALALLIVWEVAARRELISTLIYPAPSLIARTIWTETQSGQLASETLLTLRRLLIGMILGGVPGIALGLLMGWSRPIRLMLDPFIAALHPIPKIAVLPLVMVILGVNEAPKVAVAATGAFFPLLINTLDGVRQIHPIHFQVAENYGAPRWQMFRRVIWPASLPFMLTGLRLALNVTLLLVVAVEMVSARQGLGAMMWLAWELMRTERLYAALIIVVAFGLGFNVLVFYLNRLLVPWRLQRDM
jgi:NitT/TauT family transport system permease protein